MDKRSIYNMKVRDYTWWTNVPGVSQFKMFYQL